METTADIIKNYIRLISKELPCPIIIYDDYQILRNTKEFKDVSEISRWHTNEYCLKIKSNPRLHQRCVYLKKLFEKKVYKSNCACPSTCFCGVTEIAVPVKLYGKLILTVSATGIMGNISDKMTDILSKNTNMNKEEFIKLRNSTLVTAIDTEKVKAYLETLACMFKVYIEANTPKKLFEDINKANSETAAYIKKATDYIDNFFTEDIKVIDVAKACNLSSSYLQHIFLESTGKGIGDKIRINRLKYARHLLRTTDNSIKNIAMHSGFKNADYFSYAFHKEYGVAPLKYKKAHSL